jgi:methyl-accepting chemotaxis protein
MKKRYSALKLLMKPAMSLMSRLRFTWKFSLISSLFILPLLVLGIGLIAELKFQTDQISTEVQGLRSIKEIYSVMQTAERYRDIFQLDENSQNQALLEKGSALKQQLEIQIADLKAPLSGFNSESLSKRYGDLVTLWAKIKSDPSPSRGVKAKYLHYNALVVSCKNLIKDTANTSRLVLDPEIETFLLINILTQQLPNATDSMGLGRAMGTLALNSGYINGELYELLDQSYVGLDRDFDIIVSSLAYSAEINPELLSPIDSKISKAVTSIQNLKEFLSINTIEAELLSMSWSEYFDGSSVYIDNVYELIFDAIPFTESLLERRRDLLQRNFIFISISTAVLLIIIFYLLAGMYFSITDTVKKFKEDAFKATDGDLTVIMRETTKDELSELATIFNHMILNIREVVTLVKGTSDDVISLSQRLNETARISQNAITTQQKDINNLAGEIQDVEKTAQDVFSQTQNNVNESDEIHGKSLNSVKSLEQALSDIQSLVQGIALSSENISKLDETGKEIEDVLMGIKTIADQTNLLALNAAIEAARAGEQGRGFAVVADEVRNLANNTVKSTEEISEKITNFNQSIREVVSSMDANQASAERTLASSNEVTHSLQDIQNAAEDIGKSSGNIADSSKTQNEMTVRANRHINTINDSVIQSTAVVEDVVKVTTELNSLTQQLSVLVGRFTVDGITTKEVTLNNNKLQGTSTAGQPDNLDLF